MFESPSRVLFDRDPAHRYYGGCEQVDVVEDLARERACKLFGCKHANV